MNYLKNIIVSGMAVLFLYSCKLSKKDEIQVENIICQPICGDDYILGGVKAISLSDSILAVVDIKSDSMLLFFNVKAGKYLKKAGLRGRGPSEFTVLSSLNSRSGSSFFFYDLNKRAFYHTNTISDNEEILFTQVFRVDSIYPFSVDSIINGKYVATGVFENYRFCLFGADGQVLHTFGEWPYRDKEEKKVPGKIRSQAYQFDIATSPSRNKFVAHLLSADMLAFYQVKNDSVCLIKESIVTYPDYKYRNNPEHYSGTSKDSPMNYLSVTCSEKYVYALYSGKTFREHALAAFTGDIIYVYTWSGDKIAIFKSNKILKKICLSEDGKVMYAVAYDPDPILVQFSLPQWD